MPTTRTDQQSASSAEQPSKTPGWRDYAFFGLAMLAFFSGSTLGWAVWGGTEFKQSIVPFSVASVSAGIAAITLRTYRVRRAERETVDESRLRLTLAEGRLENALRGEAITVVSGISSTGVISSRIRVPSAEEISSPGEHAQRALTLAELWETTHARLGLYHNIATSQAKASFRNAQATMVVGFVLLVAFVVLALNASSTAGAIVAGGLGAVSGALSGFVSKTFIRSQEAAATHLRSYFDQPLELSRYLAAERLIANGDLSQEQRAEVLSALVQAMVASPAPPMVVTPVPGQSPVA